MCEGQAREISSASLFQMMNPNRTFQDQTLHIHELRHELRSAHDATHAAELRRVDRELELAGLRHTMNLVRLELMEARADHVMALASRPRRAADTPPAVEVVPSSSSSEASSGGPGQVPTRADSIIEWLNTVPVRGWGSNPRPQPLGNETIIEEKKEDPEGEVENVM
jgi:hypothetical protein